MRSSREAAPKSADAIPARIFTLFALSWSPASWVHFSHPWGSSRLGKSRRTTTRASARVFIPTEPGTTSSARSSWGAHQARLGTPLLNLHPSPPVFASGSAQIVRLSGNRFGGYPLSSLNSMPSSRGLSHYPNRNRCPLINGLRSLSARRNAVPIVRMHVSVTRICARKEAQQVGSCAAAAQQGAAPDAAQRCRIVAACRLAA